MIEPIDYEKINKDERFNSLGKLDVFDYSQGCADYGPGQSLSGTPNKTSVYLFDCEDKCLARMCNISTTNIDGVDDCMICGDVLREMVSEHVFGGSSVNIRMNRRAYDQLVAWWWDKKECAIPSGIRSFAGADIVIDDDIKNNQETVL